MHAVNRTETQRTVPEPLPDYIIVSPVKDEGAHLARTAESLIAQTHPPLEWTIVNDGSSDDTGAIADAYAERFDWIRVVHRAPQPGRVRGAPIVHAFNAGMDGARTDGEFVVKLDGDLYLPAHYFEWVATAFRDEPRTGIAGGSVITDYKTAWSLDRIGPDTVPGCAKAYRRACLTEIGGLQPSMGWDGIDEFAARARGWDVRPIGELQMLHYTMRGAKQSWRHARWEEGRGNHFMGYRWSFMAIRVAYRMLFEYPPLVGGLVMGAGFAWHRITRAPQVPDPLAIRQVRREQRDRMLRMLRLRKRQQARPTSGGPAYRATVGPTGVESTVLSQRD